MVLTQLLLESVGLLIEIHLHLVYVSKYVCELYIYTYPVH